MKKKSIFTLVLFTAVIICANAQYNAESDFTVVRNSDNASVAIIRYTGTSRTVNIPPTIRGLPVTIIGGQAFRSNRLTSITIPNSVTTIGDSAFVSNQLTVVTLGSGVNSIGRYVFVDNPNLTAINVSASNANYSSVDGVLYNKNRTSLIQWPAGKQGAVVIPTSVTVIGEGAFVMNQLTSIQIPNSVTSIGETAFASNQLTSITIPNNVTIIGDFAFDENPLTRITIGNGVRLGNGAFPNNFISFYERSGVWAGTYVFDGRTWSEAR